MALSLAQKVYIGEMLGKKTRNKIYRLLNSIAIGVIWDKFGERYEDIARLFLQHFITVRIFKIFKRLKQFARQ